MRHMSLPVGDILTGISYELTRWEAPPSSTSSVDEVWVALMLRWRTSSVTRISWSADTQQEGLVSGGPREGDPTPRTVIADVSERWGRIVGHRLEKYSFSHAAPPALLPWAVKLCFTSGKYLIISLGELSPEGPSYMPDSLLVTDLREVAQAISPIAALGTAWGDDCETGSVN